MAGRVGVVNQKAAWTEYYKCLGATAEGEGQRRRALRDGRRPWNGRTGRVWGPSGRQGAGRAAYQLSQGRGVVERLCGVVV